MKTEYKPSGPVNAKRSDYVLGESFIELPVPKSLKIPRGKPSPSSNKRWAYIGTGTGIGATTLEAPAVDNYFFVRDQSGRISDRVSSSFYLSSAIRGEYYYFVQVPLESKKENNLTRFNWEVKATYEDGSVETCCYSANTPTAVTAEHVLNAPSVKEWAKGSVSILVYEKKF